MGREEEEVTQNNTDEQKVNPENKPTTKKKLPKGAKITASVCSALAFIVTIIGSLLGTGA